MINLIRVCFLIFILSISFVFPLQKYRLPKSINSSSSNLLPVISPDGDILYFDRKWHPLNIGGLYDDDDIWIATKSGSNEWFVSREGLYMGWITQMNKNLFDLIAEINLEGSNALFYIFPSGTKALVYGVYSPNNQAGFAISEKINGRWNKPKPLRINDFYNESKSYSGTISSDGRVLLMSLERKDSFGDLDIYVSFRNDTTGEFSKPINLGDKINTRSIDFVSYLSYDNRTMYFASSGRKTKGKSDLFLSRRLDETWLNWSEPIPLDSVINSKWDENSISLTLLGDTAYFVSGDDSSAMGGIYFAKLIDSYRPLPYLVIQGSIFAEEENKTIPIEKPVWFQISNFDTDYTFYDTVYDGRYRIVVPYNTQYNIIVGSEGYAEKSFSSSSYNLPQTKITDYNITLRPKKLRKTLLSTVYFETDIDTLDSKAIEELENIKDFLLENSYSKIYVIGHTDEIGSDEYNNQLSLRRAKAVANYLLKNFGINPAFIETIGRGKNEPVSKQLEKNRRVEIYIIENV